MNDLSLVWKMVIRKLNWEFINNRSTKRSNNSYHKCPVHRLLIINLYFSKECVPKTYFHHGKNLNLSINWKVFDNLNARNSIFLEQGFKKRKIGKVLSLENLTTFKIIVKEEAKSATIDNTNIPTPRFPIKGEIENATSNRKRVSRFVLSLSLYLTDIIQRYTIVNYALGLQWSVVLSSTCLAPLNNALTRKRDTKFSKWSLRVGEIPYR